MTRDMDIYGYSAIGTHEENQDNWVSGPLGEDGFYALLADGCGGHADGAQASQIALQTLISRIQASTLPTVRDIEAWIAQANDNLLRRQKTTGQMKTTLVCLFCLNQQAIWAHVGDSRLYHFHDGVLEDYTNDHSVCQLAVRMGEISRRDIPTQKDRNKLLKVMGDKSCAPDIHPPVLLTPGQHAFLLCTDGLWERLAEDEIELDLYKSDRAEAWVTYLRKRAELRRYTDVDNNTAIAAIFNIERDGI